MNEDVSAELMTLSSDCIYRLRDQYYKIYTYDSPTSCDPTLDYTVIVKIMTVKGLRLPGTAC